MADIAVIGIGCRFPGDAKSPAEFYQMLLEARSGWCEVPKDRFNIDAYWHPSYDRKGTIVSRGAHFLTEDVGLFDAPFCKFLSGGVAIQKETASFLVNFDETIKLIEQVSMTQGEANSMDPQHRLLLEVTYECLENVTASDLDDTLLYATTGNGLTMMSNRLSWFYDLHGPSLTLDTACSSSLVALNLACQSIGNSKSDRRESLVAGSNLILVPDQMTTMNPLHFLSADSQCFSFDDRANGYVRGEGVGVILLKHIDDAIRDGDCIRAVIRNVECNQDGKTPGITLPSSEAQVALMRKTYDSVGLDTDVTGYFEAHGTGTAAGDPLEVSAIASVFDRTRPGSHPLFIGSVKPNIGHLEAGAGMAGLIKAILALESGVIPPNINFKNPNPRLGLAERNLKVVTQPTPWPVSGLRRASVNSFGYGGTNAHCIIDDAHHYLAARGIHGKSRTVLSPAKLVESRTSMDPALVKIDDGLPQGSNKAVLFVLSSPDQSALSRNANSQAAYLRSLAASGGEVPDQLLEDLAFTYSNRRSLFQWRISVVSETSSQLATSLEQMTKGVRASKKPGLLFCFTGQGAQWYKMGRELLSYEVFSKSITNAARYFSSIGSPWSLMEEFTASKTSSNINSPRFAQPICTVLQVALIDLLRHFGVHPSSVIGHSSGEIAAAYALGALSAEDCWKIAYHRGRLAEELEVQHPEIEGGMLAVGLGQADAEAKIARLSLTDGQILTVACVNSHESVTVSGDKLLIGQLEELLRAENIFARRLAVKNAYHSKHMELVAEQYRQSLASIKIRPSHDNVTMFSSVTGDALQSDQLDTDYWVRNMTDPVFFSDALRAVYKASLGKTRRRGRTLAANIILEIGPHATLAGPIRQSLQQLNEVNEVSYLSILRRNECAQHTTLATMGSLWAAGVKVVVSNVNDYSEVRQERIPLMDLPKYAWNHNSRYWHESTLSKSHRFRHAPRTDLLGKPVSEFTWSEPTWKNYIRLSELPWISHHSVRGSDVFPAAGMICAAIEGAMQISDPKESIKGFELIDIVISRALIIPVTDPGVEVFTRLKPCRHGTKDTGQWYEFSFTSVEAGTGPAPRHVVHCSGSIAIMYEDSCENTASEDRFAAELDRADYHEAQKAHGREVTTEEHYEATAKMGIVYGPTFRGLKAIKTGANLATFVVELQDTQATMPADFEYPFVIHPTLLDAVIQSAYQGLTHDRTRAADDAVVPTEFRRLSVSAKMPTTVGVRLPGIVRSDWISPKDCTATIKLGLENWTDTALELEGCIFTGLRDSTSGILSDQVTVDRRLASRNVWKPAVDLLDPSGEEVQLILGKNVESPESLSTAEAACTQAAIIFIQRALKSLCPDVEKSLTGHWVPYLTWLRGKYSDALAGRLPYQNEAKENWLTMTHEREEEFLQQCRRLYPADISLLYAIGTKLPEIIAGTQAPLPIMLVDDMLTKIYSDAHGMTSGLGMFWEWFDLMGHKKPDMKVLEVGAGTGSVTLPVLRALGGSDGASPRVCSYTFTDISTGWFEKAQELLKPWARLVKYKKLDIEQDPFTQGFEPESFDVIAASNVLHATRHLDITLNNCYKLLRPGGKIIIGELTWCPDHSGVIFGTLPGWWLSQDGRMGGPVISQEEWDKRLRHNNFTGLDIAVAAQDTKGAKMLSTMISTKAVASAEPLPKKAIVIRPAIESDIGAGIIDAVEAECRAASIEVTTIGLSEAGALADDGELHPESVATICLVEAVTPVFAQPTAEIFEDVRRIITKSNALFWYACNNALDGTAPPDACAISGLFRTARSENRSLRLHEVHLQARDIKDIHVSGKLILRTLRTIWASQDTDEHENEISEMNGVLMIPRIMDVEPLNKILRNIGTNSEPEEGLILQDSRPVKLAMPKNGKIEALYFADDSETIGQLPDNFIEVEVRASSINAVDIEVATARTPGLHIGFDVSGVVSKVGAHVRRFSIGDRVALLHQDAFRTHLRVHENLPQIVPANLALDQAAAIPFVYTAAYYGIFELASAIKDARILITQATGGLGQALVTLAQYAGAEVYATAGSIEKRKYLQDHLKIGLDHIVDSSSPSFARTLKRLTDGKGFDIILNTLGGEQLSTLCSCVAPFGRFINFNQKDVKANASVKLRRLGLNVSFASVDLTMMLEKAPEKATKILAKVFSLLQTEAIRPSQPTVYDYADLKKAFAAADERSHIGKVVLQMTKTSTSLILPRKNHPLSQLIQSDATYAISGGLGGIGRALACYLADHGARHVALLSRSTKVQDAAVKTIEYLKQLGVNVKVIACDVASKAAVKSAMEVMNSEMPPVKGFIHAAMHLQDGLYENMTYDQWIRCTRPKIEGTWNMHEVMPKDLDFFIMLSSIAGICGNPGQPNYAAGNSYQDAMCHYRRSLGLKACTIDLGGIGNFGWLEDNKEGSTFAESVQQLMISPEELFLMFKCAATGYTSHENACPTQLITGIGTGGISARHIAAGGKREYFWLKMQGRFAYLRQLDAQETSTQIIDPGEIEFKAALATVTSITEAATIVQGALAAKLAKSMMISVDDIDTNRPVSSYGVDSLVAAELRNWCVQEVKAVISVFEFLNAIPISTLAYQIAEKSALLSKKLLVCDI